MLNVVEWFPGSNFNPPTFNSFQASAGTTENIGVETKTYTLTADQRVQLSSISLFERMNSSGSVSGSYNVVITLGGSIITTYTHGGTSADAGTYLETLIQNTQLIMNKGDELKMTIEGIGLASGQGNITSSMIVWGSYIL